MVEEQRSAIVPNKRVVFARCRKCGRIYWYFSDLDTWENFRQRLKNHLYFAHVRKGEMTVAEAERPEEWFDFIWYRVYNPALTKLTPEQYEAHHPDFIPLQTYEEWKELAKICPSCIIRIARAAFEARFGFGGES